MLPAPLRLRRSQDFAHTVRRGARAGRDTLVVHCVRTHGPDGLVGFVVARSVGNAVVRNKVRRRLRGVVVEHSDALPGGAHIVVRALPAAASASYAQLRDDYLSALAAAARRARPAVGDPR